MEEEVLDNMVESLMELGYSREEAILEVNDLYITTLVYDPSLN